MALHQSAGVYSDNQCAGDYIEPICPDGFLPP